MKIIIDTDPGVDDALALFYTFAAPVFDVVGLTAIFGNVTVETATENAIWLCEAVGRPDIPVAMGAREPLAGHAHAPSVAVHGPHGFGNLPRRRPRGQPVAMDAADFLIARAAADPGQITLVALGPLTNVALALQRDPTFADNIAQIVVMGGAFGVPGNITPHAEANIFNDPRACAVVAALGQRVTFIGLDVTNQILLSKQDIDETCLAGGVWATFTQHITDYYLAFYASVGFTAGAGLHDPTTLIALDHPHLFSFDTGTVSVITEGEAKGKTLFTPGAGTARIAHTAQFQAILDLFKIAVGGWIAAQAVQPAAQAHG